jgi:DNA-binding XRE family transcriptional regulator
MAAPLFVRARDALNILQSELARKVGISRRTGQRWDSGESSPSLFAYQTMAEMVFPIDPALAKELAAAGKTTLEALGLVRVAPEGATRTDRALPPRFVDAIVCAAAEALNVPPGSVRPALAAAFACAREIGATLEDVERALADGPKGKKKGAA